MNRHYTAQGAPGLVPASLVPGPAGILTAGNGIAAQHPPDTPLPALVLPQRQTGGLSVRLVNGAPAPGIQVPPLTLTAQQQQNVFQQSVTTLGRGSHSPLVQHLMRHHPNFENLPLQDQIQAMHSLQVRILN